MSATSESLLAENNEELLAKIRSRHFTLTVVGLGHVGLPFASVFAAKGVNVIGVDTDSDLVNSVTKAEAPFKEALLDDYLREAVEKEKFHATTALPEAVKQADVVLLTVGTPLTPDLRPDHTHYYSAIKAIAENMHEGMLLIVRSTVAPKTVESITKQLIESATGYRLDKEFWLAACPERICEGRAIEELIELPEIIGGVSEASSQIAAEFFRIINPEKQLLITDSCTAELAKLFTNAYRYVNFALANEFGLISEECGVDCHEVLRIANTGYLRGGIPLPGLTGGPCLTKDGYFLTESFSYTDLIRVAWNLNESIPKYIVRRIKKAMGKPLLKSKVAVLGIAYKAAVDDTRYSPAVKLVECLKSEGCNVYVHDPHVKGTLSLEEAVGNADIVILAMNHPEFEKLEIKAIANLAKKDCLLMDCWGIWNANEVKQSGLRHMTFGCG